MNPVVILKQSVFFECRICNSAFDCEDYYNIHIVKHLHQCRVVLNKIKIYKCKKCSKIFILHRDYQLHQAKHVTSAVSQTLKKTKYEELYPDVGEYIKKYKCEECEAKFVEESTLKAHSVLHEPFPYICHCGIGYYKEKDLTIHMKLVKCKKQVEANKENDYSNIRYMNGSDLDEHSREYVDYDVEDIKQELLQDLPEEKEEPISSDEEYMKSKKRKKSKNTKTKMPKIKIKSSNNYKKIIIRSCEYCTREFKYVDELKLHVESHTELPHKCKNKKCFKRFLTQEEAEEHLKDHMVQCNVCHKYLASKMGLEIHSRIHTGKRPYSCLKCHKSFNQAGALKAHLLIHDDVRNFKCNFCEKKFRQKYSKEMHERTHTGEKPNVCKFCNKPFNDLTALLRHKRIHTGDFRYNCSKCFKRFTDLSGLRNHELRHGARNHDCDICNKAFYTKYDLEKHILVHSGKAKFICDYCQKKFLMKQYLVTHIRNRHRHKYPCQECSYTFAKRKRLLEHIQKLHVTVLYCHICKKKFFNEHAYSLHKEKKCYLSQKKK